MHNFLGYCYVCGGSCKLTQTKVDKLKNDNDSKWGNYPAAIEAAAEKVNYELFADEINTYYIEREIRKLKK